MACHFFVNFPPHCKQFILPLSSTDDWNRSASRPRRIPGCIHAAPASPWPRCGMWRTGSVVPHARIDTDLRCAVSHGRQPLPPLRSRVFRTLYTTDALRAAAFASSSIASCDTRDAYSFPSPHVLCTLLAISYKYLISWNTIYYFIA